jgi:hypothetical protein
LMVEAGTCAITGAVSMEAAMSAMATLRNMEIAFRGNGPPAANRLSGERSACGEPVDLFDRLRTDLDATMAVRR